MSEKIKDKKINLIIIICIAIFSMAIASKALQNDTFYTIKVGEIISKIGIDGIDHFSIHNNLPYTYPHWLYDLAIYKIYDIGGFFGIYLSTIIFSIVLGIMLFKTQEKISQNTIFSFITTITEILLLRAFVAARAQMISFILFVLEISLIESLLGATTNKNKVLSGTFLFIISVFIANIHSAVWPFFFVLFLPYIAEYIVMKILSKVNDDKETFWNFRIKKYENENIKSLFLVVIICLVTGFISPIGNLPYAYLLKTMIGNSTVHIQEHLPMILSKNIYAIIVFAFYFGIFIFTKAKVRLKDLFMTFGLLILSIFSLRQFSMFVLIGGISINLILSDFYREANEFCDKDTKKYNSKNEINTDSSKIDSEFLNKENYEIHKDEKVNLSSKYFIIAIAIAILILSSIFAIYNGKSNYIDEKLYPVKATKWLKENVDVENMKLYNEYDFGSYLLYEDIPVFIDSRADLYTLEFNGQEDILTDFFDTSNMVTYYENTFKKYGITHIMLYNNSILSQFLSMDENYKIIYLDDVIIMYEKNN